MTMTTHASADGTYGEFQVGGNAALRINDSTKKIEAVAPFAISSLVSRTAVALSTGGTFKDFLNIPASAKRITILLTGCSTNGTGIPMVQIGTGGVPTTSGYEYTLTTTGGVNIATGVIFNTGFGTANGVAATTAINASIVLTLVDPASNTWLASVVAALGLTQYACVGCGYRSLSGTLDMVRLTTLNGTDVFDNGFVNILYE